jgi:hypothetical protein
MHPRLRTPWPAFAAAGWAAALLLAAFVAPLYSSEAVDSAGTVTHSSDTLVGVNGAGIALVIAVPLVAVLLGVVALRLGHRAAAWAIVGVLAAFCLVSLLSIGVFVAPVAILLGAAIRRA